MVWFIVVRNIESNRLELVGPESNFDFDDPRYDNVSHIVPFSKEPDPQRLDFGVHELHDACACHPKLTEFSTGERIYSHSAAVN